MINAIEYYIIEAKASEWVYIIQNRIIPTLVNPVMEDQDAVLSLESSFPIFYLRRSKFAPELLAEQFGFTAAQIAHAKIIRLEPFQESANLPEWNPKDLPKPTVPYSGEA